MRRLGRGPAGRHGERTFDACPGRRAPPQLHRRSLMDTQSSIDAANPDFSEVFSTFSSALTVADIPGAVLDVVRDDIFDTLACAAAGISADGVGPLIELVSRWGGRPEATIWCTGQQVPAHHAAWVNGMMAHARDFDDTHDAAVLHAGVSVVPAAIAAAERETSASGADLLAGITAGLELICRLGVATKIGIIDSGYMYTSLFGHFAATAAAARVMRMDAAETVNALGIAYSQAAGTHQVTRDAALTKRMQPGFAAKTALISTALCRAGISGAQKTFEGLDGLFNSYFRGDYAPEILRQELGQRFRLADLSFKPYPCCRFNHTAIEAGLLLREKLASLGDPQITGIVASVNHQSHEAVGTPIEMRQNPRNIVQAQFSIPYTVACALIDGEVSLRHFSESGMANEDVRSLARRITVETDPVIERAWSRGISPTRLDAETAAGRISVQVDRPLGGPDRPMSDADFLAKFRGCLDVSGLRWPDGTPSALRGVISALHGGGDPATLIRCMCPDSSRAR
ncbi:MmgE/PrpD family protein [Oricola sp.]|uniref:MmgE/PrpD family protein n=1 Tax=Oricola sp. TaxID=1979950 RepID=UPI0025D25176|nr:MmgE/PrpD family protein [Oricola sp.]MCI5075381.1 MmgE/PrpD family protein [Oricola sp.]